MLLYELKIDRRVPQREKTFNGRQGLGQGLAANINIPFYSSPSTISEHTRGGSKFEYGMIDGLRSTDDPYLTGLFVTDKPEFDLGKWIYSNAPRISTYSLTFHAEDCKDECPLNRLYFPARR